MIRWLLQFVAAVFVGLWLITTISFVIILTLPPLLACEANPWSGYTCPGWMAPAVFLGIPGLITTPMTLVVIIAWSASAIWRKAQRDG